MSLEKDALTNGTGARRTVQRTPARIGWSEIHSRRDRPHLRRDPLRVYATRAVIWDIVAITLAGIIGFTLRWAIPFNVDFTNATYVSLVAIVILAWMAVLVLRALGEWRDINDRRPS